MKLVYLDESARGDTHYFIGGIIVNSEQAAAVETSLNSICQIVTTHSARFDPTAELHAQEIFQGRGAWREVPASLRARVCVMVAKSVADSGAHIIFRGIDLDALHRAYTSPYPAHELALAHALECAERVIAAEPPNGTHGLVLADDHHTARDSRTKFDGLRHAALRGFTNVPLQHLIDTIYFGPSHHSRLLQAADVVTYFLNRAATLPPERHPNARRSMKQIRRHLQRATRFHYIWRPRAS